MVMCPACLHTFEFNKKEDLANITKGHIVPESAGGRQWTILCKSCNSTFGSKQDKWLGEYLVLLSTPGNTVLDAKTKNPKLEINGVKVNATIGPSNHHDGFDLIVCKDRNPPGLVESIPKRSSPVYMPFDDRFDPLPSEEITVSFIPEVLRHIDDVNVGYITSAYLAWFSTIGYNWVLQPHLQFARQQMKSCTYNIDRGARVIDYTADNLTLEPLLAVSEIDGEFYPSCRIYDKLIIFPHVNSRKSLFSDELEVVNVYLLTLHLPYLVAAISVGNQPLVVPMNELPKRVLRMTIQPTPSLQWLKRTAESADC